MGCPDFGPDPLARKDETVNLPHLLIGDIDVMDLGIKGLRVIVTAGAAGIGREVARTFQREGARMFATSTAPRSLSSRPAIPS
jgi:hypothetical protein